MRTTTSGSLHEQIVASLQPLDVDEYG
eukprot:COSAG06_NODE_50023_length_321_cov_0.932432_1_plen_26_part_01